MYQKKRRKKQKEYPTVTHHQNLEDYGHDVEIHNEKKSFEDFKNQKYLTAVEFVDMRVWQTEMPQFDSANKIFNKDTGKLRITKFWLGYVNDDIMILSPDWVLKALI